MEGLTLTFPANGKPPKQTCRQCRHRKVRCPGVRDDGGSCDECFRLGHGCSFRTTPNGNPSSTTAVNAGEEARPSTATGEFEDRPEPRRVSKACNRCRRHKIRCSGGNPCACCRKKGLDCEYPSLARSKNSLSGRRMSVSASSSMLHPPRAGDGASTVSSSPAASPELTGGREMIMDFSTAPQNHVEFQDPPQESPRQPLPTNPTIARVSGQSRQPLRLMPPYVVDRLRGLFDFFFDYIYPLPSYSFFHPPTLRQRFIEGRLEICLAYAIAAVASVRSPPHARQRDEESAWAKEAETIVWNTLDKPTVPRLQAILLVVLYRVETADLRRAFMLSALVGRAAAVMRFNHERSGEDSVPREVRRRLLWCLKVVERYFSTALPEFELISVENMYIKLPKPEVQFIGGLEMLPSADDQGSLHLCVSLEMLRKDIMKLNRSLSLCDEPFPQLPSLIRDFETHLDRIEALFPGGRQLSPAQWSELYKGPYLARHLHMRLSWHECQCDLKRILLRRFREAAPPAVIDALDPALVDEAEKTVVHHAAAIVQILAILTQEGDDARPLDFDSAICAYSASRLLLFLSRFGFTSARPSADFALSRAEHGLAALRRFFPDSPLVKPIVKEIELLMAEFMKKDAVAPSRLVSPRASVAPDPRDPGVHLSEAARVRSRLAIHSLLRQAGFSDDEDDNAKDDAPGMVPECRSSPSQLISPSRTKSASQTYPAPLERGNNPPEMPSDSHTTDHTTPGSHEGELWQYPFAVQAAPLIGWDTNDSVAATDGAGSNYRSFIFPWLQREQAEGDVDMPP